MLRPRALPILLTFAAAAMFAGVPLHAGTPGESPIVRAETLLREGRFAEARDAFDELARDKPEAGRAWWGLGNALLSLGSTDDAIASFEQCVELAFNPSAARYNVACALALDGDPEGAFDWLDRAMASGFHDFALLERDPDLNALRDDPRFARYAKSYGPRPDQDVEVLEGTAEDGVRVHGELRLGADTERATGTTVLLMHQSGSNVAEYDTIAPRLNALGYHTLALDLRGGGGAYGHVNLTVDALPERGGGPQALLDMRASLALLTEAGLRGPVVLWGSSYTAGRQFQWLRESPERVVAALAFSPGAAFARREDPDAPSWSEETRVPVFVSWPNHEYDKDRRRRYESIASGRKTLHVQAPGAHGSSALNPEGHERIWTEVERFLKANAR